MERLDPDTLSPEQCKVVMTSASHMVSPSPDIADEWRVVGAQTVAWCTRLIRATGGEVTSIQAGRRDAHLVFAADGLPGPGERTAYLERVLRACPEADLRFIVAPFFIVAGFLANPVSSSYHLEFTPLAVEAVPDLLRLLQAMQLPARAADRGGRQSVFLSSGEAVSRFLLVSGAHRALLRFEELRAERELLATVNRQLNCDEANSSRLARAVADQLAAIDLLERTRGWGSLSPELAEAAKMRRAYPAYSLQELGGMMRPPISKSGMRHRLNRLLELADQVRRELGEGNGG